MIEQHPASPTMAPLPRRRRGRRALTPPTIFPYVPSPDTDRLLTAWWQKMSDDGDLERLFVEQARGLGTFFRIVGPPHDCIYAVDNVLGIWWAMWFERIMGGVWCSAWCAKERRRTRQALHAFLFGWDLALSIYPCCIGITKQPALLPEHERLGYTVLGRLPAFWDGQDAWALLLTRDGFTRTLARLGYTSTRTDAIDKEVTASHG